MGLFKFTIILVLALGIFAVPLVISQPTEETTVPVPSLTSPPLEQTLDPIVASFAGESCSTKADCSDREVCVAGTCGSCNFSTAGQQCSDDNFNPYTNDGVCTSDRRCQEAIVCDDPGSSNIFAGCLACGDGAACDPNAGDGLSFDSVCNVGVCEVSEYFGVADGNFTRNGVNVVVEGNAIQVV